MIRTTLALLISTLCILAGSATAQDFPSKPIRFIVANAAASSTDLVARIMGTEMSRFIGQPIVVENKTGADGLIGFEYVAKQAQPDGYTLLVTNVTALASVPALAKDPRFDAIKDLPPVISFAESRTFLVSYPQMPWKTLNEMVAYAKANPGKLNYGASATNVRLVAEAIVRHFGLNIVHIPYGGGPAYMTAISTGEVHLGVLGEPGATAFGDKFRVLAQTGDQRRAPYLDVPTFAELGLPLIPGITYSINVRSGAPKAAVDKVHVAASRALQEPAVRASIEKLGLQVVERTSEVAAKRFADEAKFLSDMAAKLGIQPQ